MDTNDRELVSRLVRKLSERSGLSVDVLNERLQSRKLNGEETITLLMGQIFLYENSEARETPKKKPSIHRRRAGKANRTNRRRQTGAHS